MLLTKEEKIKILKSVIAHLKEERYRMQDLVEMNFAQVEEQRKKVLEFDFQMGILHREIKEIKKDATS